jgi:hypothetical protein
MRFSTSTITILVTLGTVACSGGSATLPPAGQGGVAESSIGGDSAAGGQAATGGAISNGGNVVTGGTPSVGGQASTGGVMHLATGGVLSAAGGSIAVATGGYVPGAGGVSPTGGSLAAMGGTRIPTGGVFGVTGGNAAATGGSKAATGGAAALCVDTPRSSENCADAKTWGFCSQSWFAGYCQVTCGTCGSGVGGSSGIGGGVNTGGSPPGAGGTPATGGRSNGTGGSVAAPTGGSVSTGTCGSSTNPSLSGSTSSGFTTRYWDCCMPSCSWKTNLPWCDKDGTTKHTGTSGAKSGCESGGNAFECFDFSPWYDSATNMSYGFAAYNAANCGVCFKLQFTGDGQYGPSAGATAIKGQQMIVQVINIGNIGAGQFDLLIPGGGVGAMSAGCPAQLGSVNLGATNGGMLTACNGDVSCTKTMCQTAFAGKTGLLNGCSWFTDCFKGADNPKIIYQSVSCPSQLTSKSGISG